MVVEKLSILHKFKNLIKVFVSSSRDLSVSIIQLQREELLIRRKNKYCHRYSRPSNTT